MKHVLIMEDNALLAIDWKDVFELNGHKVTLTHTGEDAVAHLKATKFDLVITDLFVPNAKGGLHVIHTIVNMKTDAPPVIAVTGSRIPNSRWEAPNVFLESARLVGAAKSIQKPFPAAELLLMAHEFWDRL